VSILPSQAKALLELYCHFVPDWLDWSWEKDDKLGLAYYLSHDLNLIPNS